MKRPAGVRHLAAAVAVVLFYVAGFLAVQGISALLGDDALPPSTFEGALALATVFPLSAAAAYFFVVSLSEADHTRSRRVPGWAPAAAVFAILAAVSLAFPPIASGDGAWNAFMGTLAPKYGANPYLSSPGDFPGDPLAARVASAWRSSRMVYGPLWTDLSMVPAIVFPGSPEAQMLGLRVLNVAGYAAAGFVLHAAYRRKKGARGASDALLAAWLLNPAAIFETANGGHNEGVLVFALAVAAAGMMDESVETAIYGVTAAALVKIWPVVLFPSLLGLARKDPKRAWRAAAVGVLATLAVALPFGSPLVTFGNAGFILSASNGYFFSPLRFMVSDAVVRGSGDAARALVVSGAAAMIAFFAVVAWSARASWTGRRTALACATALATGYFFVATPWLQPWHLIALLPFIVFSPAVTVRASLLLSLCLSLWVFAMYFVPAGFIAIFFCYCVFIALMAAMALRGYKKTLQPLLEG